jgi:polysaccharide export outer membrane protein
MQLWAGALPTRARLRLVLVLEDKHCTSQLNPEVLPMIKKRLMNGMLLLAVSMPAWSQELPPYLLRHGDRLMVSVWREEGLSREVRVLPDGSISFPLVGRLMVAGTSTPDVEMRITERLKRYIPEASVTAAVIGTEGNSVYVLGKVLKPGQIQLAGPNMTVLQVLSQVGGLDRFANGDAILVMRRDEGGRQRTMNVRYNDLMRGTALDTNLVLQAGDTVLVP